ncbi:Acyl-CoA oxidase [Cooperia oncophora]
MPQLARAFAFMFAAYEMRDLYMKVTEQLTHGNVDLLPEIHALSSGLKSVVSWEAAQGIEQCRLACGGHGYSLASAFPEIYAYSVGGCTYEGENTRNAVASCQAAEEVRSGNARLAAICGYLAKPDTAHSKFSSWQSYSDSDIVFRAYDTLKRHQRETSSEEAWNRASIELCKASRMHVRLYIVRTFLEKVATAPDASLRSIAGSRDPHSPRLLLSNLNYLPVRREFSSESQAEGVRDGIYRCLERLRPNAVSLVDSWDFDDAELHSVLGRRDGNVYPALLEWAQKSQLNRTEVLPTFEKYLGPMMKEGRSKL